MAKGYSISALAGQIGVDRVTLYGWEKAQPEFKEALAQARFMRVNALEHRLLTSYVAPRVNAAIFALKNAMPDEWRDRYEHTGADGGPIAVTVARFTEERPTVIEGEIVPNTAAITYESK